MALLTITALSSAPSVSSTDEMEIQRSGVTSTEKTTLGAIAAAVAAGAAGFTASGTGAVARSLQAKMRDAVSVKDFGATGDGTTSDQTAFANAIATGKCVYVPAGNYRLTGALTLQTSGQVLFGDGPWQSIIEWDGGSVNAIVMQDQQYMGVRDLMIRPKSGSSALTSGYAIAFARSAANTFMCDVTNVLIYQMFNGVLTRSVTEAIVKDVLCWGLTGTRGVLFDGTAAGPSYAATLDGLRFGGMASNTSITLVAQDSFGYSLRMRKCVLLYGGIGFRMLDTLATGSSYPIWCLANGVEIDHPNTAGISLEAGEGLSMSNSWVGSCLAGPGVQTTSNWRGECTITATRIMGNYTHGVALGAGVDAIITDNVIGDNSAAGSGTYHGINVAANLTRFIIANNRIGDVVGVAGNNQGYGVNVAAGTSDYYQIVGNIITVNATGQVNDGGTGINKLVQNEFNGFKKLQLHDNQFYLADVSGDPAINFDANDTLAFTRSSDALSVIIASAARAVITNLIATFNVPVQFPTYTVTTLPTASSFPRCGIYVSNGTSNKRFAISDGTNWRWPDGAIVS